MSILEFQFPISVFPTWRDDDISDRLHHRWTVLLLAVLGFFSAFATYFGDPIHCWCPAEFTDTHCNYTESICWISDTYYIPQNEYIPTDISKRKDKEIKYYQWVPMILFFLALAYKIPNILWTALNTKSGLNIGKIVSSYENSQIGEERDDHMHNLSHRFNRWLTASNISTYGTLHRIIEKVSVCFCFCLGRRRGAYLAGLYLTIKLCYLAVSIGLLLLLNKFLAMNYTVYGAEVISSLAYHSEIDESPRFPRVTLCDFRVRQLQNLHRYTVQCVLSINLFNEKIFGFLWFWFLLIVLIGVFSYITWVKNIIIPGNKIQYVDRYLSYIDKTTSKDISPDRENMLTDKSLEKAKVQRHNKFIRDFLATDGVFALRMLEYNTSEMMIYELVKDLWEKWHVDD